MGVLSAFGLQGYFPAGAPHSLPEYTYTGVSQLIDDGDGTWRIKFLTSGVFTLTDKARIIDLFLVGGGGGGAQAGGGGGGGYTALHQAVSAAKNTAYAVTVGAGGASTSGVGNPGSASSAFGYLANGGGGGFRGTDIYGRFGGNGGSGGGGYNDGVSGLDGANGGDGDYARGGFGQGTTTREFHEPGAALYASGGASGPDNAGEANTGDGGDGFGYNNDGMAGGSGIVIIRSHVV